MANLPKGLHILPSIISSLFSFFLLRAKLSQYLLDRFSRSFHQMEGICVNFLDQVHFFQFLKGCCHGNQFCVVSKTQIACDLCNFYTIWKSLGVDSWSEIFFQYLKGRCHDNQVCFVPDSSLGAEVSQNPLDRFLQSLHHMVDIEWQMISPTFFCRYLKGLYHGNQFSGKNWAKLPTACIYRSVIQKLYGITPCMCKII